MKYSNLIVDKKELAIIKSLIHPISESANLMNSCISRLKEELKTATVVEDENELIKELKEFGFDWNHSKKIKISK